MSTEPAPARPVPFADQPWGRAISTVLRLGLGVVWLVAGSLKVGDAPAMVRSVRAFRLLPESLVHPVAYAVPFVEIALGALLVLGLAVRLGAVLSSVLLAVYITAIASAAARGLRIECGCFSQGGDLAKGAPTHYTSELIRDSLLLLASLLLAVWPGGYLTLDRLLFGPPTGRAADGDPDEWDDWDGQDERWDGENLPGEGSRRGTRQEAGDRDDVDRDEADRDGRRAGGAGDDGDWHEGYRARRGGRSRSEDGAGRMGRER